MAASPGTPSFAHRHFAHPAPQGAFALAFGLVVLAHRPHQGDRHQHQHQRERQRENDGGGLYRLQAAREQQRQRDAGHQQPPDDLHARGRVRIAPGAHRAQHQRGRVARGHEEHDHQHRRHDGHRQPQRHRAEHGEHRGGRVGLRRGGQGDLAEDLEVQRGAAEDREPQEAHQAGRDHRAQHEFADRAPTRDARDEQPHERRPRDPPRPVEDGPVAHPGAVPERRHAQAGADEFAEVGAQRVGEGVHQRHRGPEQEHRQRQEGREQQVGAREPLDAPVHAAHRRGDEQRRRHHDDGGLRPGAHRQAEHRLQAAVDLRGAHAERGGDPEGRGHHRQHVHQRREVAHAAPGQRFGGGAHQGRGLPAELEECDRQPDDAVDRPGMQPPVEEGVAHGGARGLGRLRGDAGRRQPVVRDRLRHTPEHQADAHARREEHREPCRGGELGFLVLVAQLQVAVAAQGQEEGQHDQCQHHPQVQPPEIPRDVRQQRAEEGAKAGGGRQPPEHHGRDQPGRDGELEVAERRAPGAHER